MGSDGESQTRVHPAGIAFNRCVDEFLDLGEIDYFIKFPRDLLTFHSENCTVEEDIFPTRQLGMKAGPDLKQRPDPAVKVDLSFGRLSNAREDLKQRRFAGAVSADDPEHLAGHHFK